jgi:hypothetical protein
MWVPNKKLIFPQRRFAHPSMSLLGEDSMMMAASAGGAFTPDAAVSDGTNNYMHRGGDLTGNANGSNGLLSCWVRFNGDDGVLQYFLQNTGGYFSFAKTAYNKIELKGWAGATNVIGLVGDTSIVADSTWRHIAASWNGTSSHLYLDGVAEGGFNSPNSGSIDYTRANWYICSNSDGGQTLHADISELYFALEYLDISDASELEKFRSSGGEAVDLGSDGSTPTGNQPIIYCHLPDGGTADTEFNNQNGSGGTFTVSGSFGETDGPNG